MDLYLGIASMAATEFVDQNIVILAGGISSRMKKSIKAARADDSLLLRDAERKSKAMIGVSSGSRPFLNYLLENVERAGYSNVIIVVSEKDNSIFEYYKHAGGANHFKRMRISYALQKIPTGRIKPLGTADALLEALKEASTWRGQKFTVCNSDNLYSVRALRLLLEDTHDNAMIDYDRSALQFGQERIMDFAVLEKDAEGFLQNIIEKPSPEEIKRACDATGRVGVSMNIFRLSYDRIYPFLQSAPLHPKREEKELPVAIKMMVEAYPRSLFTIPLAEHVPDLTTQADIAEVKRYLDQEFPKEGHFSS